MPTPIFDISAKLGIDNIDSDQDDQMSVDLPGTTSSSGRNKPPTSGPKLAKMSDGPIIPDVDSSLYMYRDIPFNLGIPVEMRRHEENLIQLVCDLKRQVSTLSIGVFADWFLF